MRRFEVSSSRICACVGLLDKAATIVAILRAMRFTSAAKPKPMNAKTAPTPKSRPGPERIQLDVSPAESIQ